MALLKAILITAIVAGAVGGHSTAAMAKVSDLDRVAEELQMENTILRKRVLALNLASEKKNRAKIEEREFGEVHEMNTAPREGQVMLVQGLTSNAGQQLNGAVCLIKRFDNERGRWLVTILPDNGSGDEKAFKEENLVQKSAFKNASVFDYRELYRKLWRA